MSVYLEGVAAQFYRGIGKDIQYIAPFSKMNFFIGANNAGKSIVLNLLATQLSAALGESTSTTLDGAEEFRGSETGKFALAVGAAPDRVARKLAKQFPHLIERQVQYNSRSLADQVSEICHKLSSDGLIWVYPDRNAAVALLKKVDPKIAIDWVKDWASIWGIVARKQDGSAIAHWVPQTINIIAQHARPSLPPIQLIPAKRVLGEKGEAFDDLSGRGLIDYLAMLQNPAWDQRQDNQKFLRITRFVQEVTGKADATLEVPHDRQHLLVHMDNKVLPLSSLGTGIHEVILIAAFCTIHDETIMCIEEPEIHLHPLLQRKLVAYLMKNTKSQYFIATHSSAFIDTPGSNVFHVANDGDQTRVRAVLTKEAQREILDDLGYQASDILQTNAVVWVEGPSDRIYLNHWIKAAAADLREGVHYTIMFYGGGLISHLSSSDEALDEFIRLRDLNRNMAIVMDSDRDSEDASLKRHVQRLADEMSEGSGVAWVTAGREIENYVEGAKLQAALKSLHPTLYLSAGKTGRYDHAFYFWRDDPDHKGKRKTHKNGDKVGAASIICDEGADLDMLDLRERVGELVQMIRRANGVDR